ncbi:Chemotaxis phosphatase CheX [Bryocella elongata]|uniref:Chemotaxis phosphatase CheX n=2 Tax=Bryocella elongata TaxID=863522 RepID=A0A1H5TGJ3_9BACT|nr:Chemotaxis phosphatase CheX [Bryocella elongata]
MTKTNVDEVLIASACNVLETMFFSEAIPAQSSGRMHDNPIVCLLHTSGAAEGTFSIAVDREALRLLCISFYGEDAPPITLQQELACELTNMIAGSTLSNLVPEHYCSLSAPQLCSLEQHETLGKSGEESTSVLMEVEGGLLSASCSLRM